jgi:hypothetical protein
MNTGLTTGRAASSRILANTAPQSQGATRAIALSIYTPTLEPLIYDHGPFLEPVKRLVLATATRLRVLISSRPRSQETASWRAA